MIDPKASPAPLPYRSWSIEFTEDQAIDNLKSALNELHTSNQSRLGNSFQFLVDRYAGLKIEIFAREHPPPHFRVICAGEAANYRISDCYKLNGALNNEYRAIRDWHSENKNKLIDAWNKFRPSDCPVGEYRED